MPTGPKAPSPREVADLAREFEISAEEADRYWRRGRETLLTAPKRHTSIASNGLKHMPHVIEPASV